MADESLNFDAEVKAPVLPEIDSLTTEDFVPIPEGGIRATAAPPRVTVTGMAYHQFGQGGPIAVTPQYVRVLTTDEQPYQRRLTVGEQWAPLDCGWLDRASLLVVDNRSGEGRTTWPTAEEREAEAAAVIEVGVVPSPVAASAPSRPMTQHGSPPSTQPAAPIVFSEIPPGEHSRIVPGDLKKYRLRCRKGSCKVVVTLFPV